MTNTIDQISPTYSLSAIRNQTATTDSSTSEIMSSFKDIFSTMMMGGGASSGQESSSGIGDLMTPLLMIILLEKLVESQVEGPTENQVGQGSSSVASLLGKNEPSGRPVGGVLTQEFHPGHNGLDFGIPVGTEVKATMDGNVTYAGWNNQGYGNLVIVENGDYKTYYAHLSSIPVAVGDTVGAGTTIGLSGNTGNSTGPHLHYEIRRDNAVIDPTALTLGA
jgi:murein DD-endopeptidase MepM/ murein hydrolase activator NlpD